MSRIVQISPSILAINYKDEELLKKMLATIDSSHASMIHLDVMDGKFVKNKTFDHTMVEFCKKNSSLMLDVHLMIENPEKYIDEYINAGADILTIHFEATKNPAKLLEYIKSKNVIAGISISPVTPVSKIKKIIEDKIADLVLVMSVEPGNYGQKFIPGSAEKVAEVRGLSKSVTIEVDGGINLKNAGMLRKLGANILVSGATIMKSNNIKKTIRLLAGFWF